jgi:hypothetical protein
LIEFDAEKIRCHGGLLRRACRSGVAPAVRWRDGDIKLKSATAKRKILWRSGAVFSVVPLLDHSILVVLEYVNTRQASGGRCSEGMRQEGYNQTILRPS